jgi:hypothetical protein
MNLDRLYSKMLQGLAFFWPLYVLGIPAGGFDFTIPVCLLLLISCIVLIRGRFHSPTLATACVFLAWCLLVTLPRYQPSAYLLSWMGLGAMLLPFCGVIPESLQTEKILDGIYWGAIVSFGFAIYEIAVTLAGLPPLEEIFTFGLWPKVRTAEFLGIQRVKSTMAEPAHYARYLVFVYAILDTATLYGYKIRRDRLFRAVWFLILLSTLSLTSVVLTATYVGVVAVSRWRRGLQKLFVPQFWIYVGLSPFALVGVLYAAGVSPVEVIELFADRFEGVIQAIQFGVVVGSEGSRIQSTLILFRYLGSQDALTFFIGEGYSQASLWLEERFGHLPKNISSFARGDLHNVFSAVGISTGIVGLSLYISYIANLLLSHRWMIPAPIAIVWVVSHFATGYLIGYHFWTPLLLAGCIFRSYKFPREASKT